MPKIAYLFGAGASAGEMNQRGALKNILMDDIIDGIIQILPKRIIIFLYPNQDSKVAELWNLILNLG